MAPRRVPDSLRARTARGGVGQRRVPVGGGGCSCCSQGLLATALLGAGRDRPLRRRHDDRDDDRRAAAGGDRRGVRAGDADDEEAEFQRALTVELALGLLGALAGRRAARRCSPRAYDDDGCSALTLAVTYLPVAFALQAPQWVFFKRMEYVRLRTLQAIVPLGTVAVDRAAAAGRRGRLGAGDRAVRAATWRRSWPRGGPRRTGCGCGRERVAARAICGSRGRCS